jgi:hypothetical protein
VVILRPTLTTGNPSNEIVYVLQHEGDLNTPVSWTGRGRLLVSNGILAIIAEDGTRRLFKFREREVPPSLRQYDFETTVVFGIARYWVDAPLTKENLALLRQAGSCGRQGLQVIQPNNAPGPCSQPCDSGGEGATNCTLSSGGFSCSVTCGTGTYACCYYETPNNPKCKCCGN